MAEILSKEEIEELLDICNEDYKYPGEDVLNLLHAEEDCILRNIDIKKEKAKLIKFVRENVMRREVLDTPLLHNLIALFRIELERRGEYQPGIKFLS